MPGIDTVFLSACLYVCMLDQTILPSVVLSSEQCESTTATDCHQFCGAEAFAIAQTDGRGNSFAASFSSSFSSVQKIGNCFRNYGKFRNQQQAFTVLQAAAKATASARG